MSDYVAETCVGAVTRVGEKKFYDLIFPGLKKSPSDFKRGKKVHYRHYVRTTGERFLEIFWTAFPADA